VRAAWSILLNHKAPKSTLAKSPPAAAGISDPVISKPANWTEAEQNMRGRGSESEGGSRAIHCNPIFDSKTIDPWTMSRFAFAQFCRGP